MARNKTNPAQNAEPQAKPNTNGDAAILHGSDTLPALIELGEDRQAVQLGEVVARAHQESGLTVDDWNALPTGDRDAKLQAVIEAMRADPRAGSDEADTKNSDAPDAGDPSSQANSAGNEEAPTGGEGPAGGVLDHDKEPEGGWCYPVLTPFKFRGGTPKPGAFIQLTREEAVPYLVAGVISDDVCYPPDPEPAE